MDHDLKRLIAREEQARTNLENYRVGETPLLNSLEQAEWDLCNYVLSQMHMGASFGYLATKVYPSSDPYNAAQTLGRRMANYFVSLSYRARG